MRAVAYMGDIVVPADTEGLQDGDLLCHLLHPPAGAILNTKPPASAAATNGMPSDATAVGAWANGMGVSPERWRCRVSDDVMERHSTRPHGKPATWLWIPVAVCATFYGFGTRLKWEHSGNSFRSNACCYFGPVFIHEGNADPHAKHGQIRWFVLILNALVCYDAKDLCFTYFIFHPFRVTAKVVRWYKRKGDPVEFNDVLCDIVTEVGAECWSCSAFRDQGSLILPSLSGLYIWNGKRRGKYCTHG